MKIHKNKKTKNLEQLVDIENRFNIIHSHKFNYKLAIYKNNKTEIEILCPIHGSFWQRPDSHMRGIGCAKCSGKYHYTTVEFITEANRVHDNKYKYTNLNYINNSQIIDIICPEHGIFKQRAGNHLKGRGCHTCGGSLKNTLAVVIDKCNHTHKNQYTYNNSIYINYHTLFEVTCSKHGAFFQTPANHITGTMCPSCVDHGFNPSKPALLYSFCINNIYKIGITNRTVKERYYHKDFEQMSKIVVKKYEIGKDAYTQEQLLISKYKDYAYTGPTPFTDGTQTTECFTVDVLNTELNLKEYIWNI